MIATTLEAYYSKYFSSFELGVSAQLNERSSHELIANYQTSQIIVTIENLKTRSEIRKETNFSTVKNIKKFHQNSSISVYF